MLYVQGECRVYKGSVGWVYEGSVGCVYVVGVYKGSVGWVYVLYIQVFHKHMY